MQIRELIATIQPYLKNIVFNSVAHPFDVHDEAFLDRQVAAISTDSRDMKADGVFVAIRGLSHDGHQHVQTVLTTLPSVIVVEDEARFRDLQNLPTSQTKGVVLIRVDSTKAAINRLAHGYFGSPVDQLFVVGVTGTNGKTTVTHMIEHVFNELNDPTGVMGTINHHLRTLVWPTDQTTPNTVEFYKRLSQFLKAGAKAVAMEVSSHALKQKRIDDVDFDVAVFTNLSRDHLDYHPDMQDYFESKEILFRRLLADSKKSQKTAVLNGDDDRSLEIRTSESTSVFWFFEAGSPRETLLLEKAKSFGHRLLSYTVRAFDFQGMKIKMKWGTENLEFLLPMIGRHNAANAAAAIGAGLARGFSFTACLKALESFGGVRGRLEYVPNSRGVFVFVDYAHTDQALEHVLRAITEVREQQNQTGRSGRILTIVGCGGDRDRGKRPLMGQVAALYSDETIVTSDNPRTEDPMQIINEILAGMPLHANVTVEVDRKEAIHLALQMAEPGDVLLIAGKGHEDYQIVGKEKIHFDDVEVVKEYVHGMVSRTQ